MIGKLAAAGALIVAVWAIGVGIDRAGGERLILASGDHEGVLTPETPIDLDAIVANRTIKHTALVSVEVPKVSSIDPGSVRVTTPGYSVDDVRTTPILEFRPQKNPAPRSILLLLDNSTSMREGKRAGEAPSDPDYHRIDACRLLLQSLKTTDRVSLACFPCRHSVLDQLNDNKTKRPYELLVNEVRPTDAEQAVEKLREEENGSTPLYRAVTEGANTLAKSPVAERRVMVLLTDGKDSDDLTQGVQPAVQALRQAEVELYAIGLGPGADNESLRKMTPNVVRVDDATTLDRTFRGIVQQISREVVQVDLDVILGRSGKAIPSGQKVDISFRSNGRLYTTKGVTK